MSVNYIIYFTLIWATLSKCSLCVKTDLKLGRYSPLGYIGQLKPTHYNLYQNYKSKLSILPSEGISFEENKQPKTYLSIVHTRWNPNITEELKKSVIEKLGALNSTVVKSVSVPGAFELPLMAQKLAEEENCQAVIAIGCLIKGETYHFEYIADAVSHGLMKVQLKTQKPVIFGVLTCNNIDEAMRRTVGPHAHGPSWAETAVEMVNKLSN